MRLMTVPEAHRAVDAVWRLESARIIAGLARLVNDVGLAEELAQDALVAALRQWPESGIPPNPGAWLMATAASGDRPDPPERAAGPQARAARPRVPPAAGGRHPRQPARVRRGHRERGG